MDKETDRRHFLKCSATLGAIGMLSLSASNHVLAKTSNKPPQSLNVSVFSKHLQFLNYKDMADAATEMGFDGVDLTVRPKGHVSPERVTQDLPKAVEGLLDSGLAPNLMTTAITGSNQPHTNAVLNSASKLGFQLYRLGYFRFPKHVETPHALKNFASQLNELAELNKKYNIKGAYQNHAGAAFVGAQLWDIWHMLKDVDKKHMGCQYDIRHASVEGAQSWSVPLNMLRNHINSIVLKDYKWQKIKGKWVLQNVPIGEGMVDFHSYFKLLKELKINVPVSMHFEYDLGGAEHGQKRIATSQQAVFKMMKKDLGKVRSLWQEANT